MDRLSRTGYYEKYGEIIVFSGIRVQFLSLFQGKKKKGGVRLPRWNNESPSCGEELGQQETLFRSSVNFCNISTSVGDPDPGSSVCLKPRIWTWYGNNSDSG